MRACEQTGRIHSIESFGTVDGPGIRYVVFFQGCLLRCRYCHNPDTWKLAGGRAMTVDEILAGMERGRSFYRRGGLTCSGGEPLLQLPFLVALLREAKRRGIHTCLDTSGVTAPEYEACFSAEDTTVSSERSALREELFAALDLILMDFKHADGERHRALTGQPPEGPLAFARAAERHGVPMIARHVLAPGWTDDERQLAALGRLLAGFTNVRGLEVLPYHTMGVPKYESLNIPYPLRGAEPLTAEDAEAARRVILRAMRG